jgi:hypothetical protein
MVNYSVKLIVFKEYSLHGDAQKEFEKIARKI